MKLKVIILLPVFLLLGGCGITLTSQQKEILNSYASSASNIGTQASAGFKESHQDLVYAKKQLIVLEGMSNNIPLNQLEGPLAGSNLTVRIKAAEALAQYGELLNNLASANRNEDFEKAANSLSDGIAEFDSELIDSDLQENIAKAVSAIGGIFVERKKTKAIRQVVVGYHDSVNKLCEAMLNDIGLEDEEEGVSYYLETTCQKIMLRAPKILRQDNASVADRDTAMTAWSFAKDTRSEINNRSERMVVMLKLLKDSNDALFDAFQNGVPKNFKSVKDEIENLADLAQELTDI